jgi:hypothetical protein
MLIARILAHSENYILYTCRLRSWPVKKVHAIFWGETGGIKDNIAYLSIKNICRAVVLKLRVISVSVNKSKARKPRGSLDNREVIWVTMDMCHIVWENW